MALNAVLLCVLVWLLVFDKKTEKRPAEQDGIEASDSLKSLETQKDSLESSNSSCVYEPGNGAGGNVPGSHSGDLQ